ncbi:NAD(P)-dependent oxidoreductase [Lacisediminihabitans profunda]|uniref:NAD(P)-dependent oxidoreductase n=1 Tax=Lacisediminihabitans profunda TaxID=2594790 RepID=A0A5C8UQY8_9MICO|nr:NAD(P)-dependent oxidoreductase [Lacisediminihabitans profunda]TXN29960.1 NAD(P)-dependent oxidoreductase [Lacisediminihabitans profunda]
MTDTRIGFIGLGNMGGRMTACILRAGKEVLGFDAKTENIATVGATPAASAAAVMEGSDVVLLSLPDSRVVEAVVLGDDGLLAHTKPGQVVVDLSTSAPESTRRISALFAEKGVQFIDAGISGGAAAADKGTLTLMVGGSEAALNSVRDVLGYFTTNVFYVGATGAGHTTKLLNNFLNAVALSATAEVMVAAKKAGLDLATVLEVFNKSSGVNFATINRFPKIITGDYLKGGLTNTLMMKDVTLYADLLAQLGVASLNSAGPMASFGLARALGYADEISNTVVDAIGDISGGIRLYDGEVEA